MTLVPDARPAALVARKKCRRVEGLIMVPSQIGHLRKPLRPSPKPLGHKRSHGAAATVPSIILETNVHHPVPCRSGDDCLSYEFFFLAPDRG